MEADSKVILLPAGRLLASYRILRIPDPQDLDRVIPILIDLDLRIYLVGEIKGDSTYAKGVQLKCGGAVKSFIFENCDSTGAGFVLQNPNTLVTNVFDPTFLFITILYCNPEIFSKRFITYEDLSDQISNKYGSWIHDFDKTHVMECLERVCDSINEGDEPFYKFLETRAASFVHGRVETLKSFFVAHPKLSIHSVIREHIVPPHQELSDVPASVIESAIQHYAFDMVCGSYLLPAMKAIIIKHFQYDFDELNQHISKIQESLRNLLIVEENMNALASSGNTKNSKKAASAPKNKRAAAKKVDVGKGALDGFFKRA